MIVFFFPTVKLSVNLIEVGPKRTNRINDNTDTIHRIAYTSAKIKNILFIISRESYQRAIVATPSLLRDEREIEWIFNVIISAYLS